MERSPKREKDYVCGTHIIGNYSGCTRFFRNACQTLEESGGNVRE
jgi:hypothetical protein